MRGNTYSKKQSSEQISRKLSEFIKEIQYKNRNPVDNNVLKMLQEMETNPELLFDSQQYLYRSRIVHSKDKLNGEYPMIVRLLIPRHCANSSCVKECFFRRSRTFSPNFMFVTFLWSSYRAVTMCNGICKYSI